MRKVLFCFILLILFSCNHEGTIDSVSQCDEIRYGLIHPQQESYEQWKLSYMDYVSNCIQDSNQAKYLAMMDANNEEYTFIIYGMIASTEPYENIYNKYMIGFYSPGCDLNKMGEIYNQELKRLLKENHTLDYDSILKEEFSEPVIYAY